MGLGAIAGGVQQEGRQSSIDSSLTRLLDHAMQFTTTQDKEALAKAISDVEFLAEHMREVDEPTQLQVVGEMLFAIRKATGGGTLTLADGTSRKLTKPQVRLVKSLSPKLAEMLHEMEEVMGSKGQPQLGLYIAEVIGYELGTSGMISKAASLPQVVRMLRYIDSAVSSQPELDSGAPFIFKGLFHLSCPFPLRSVSKAKVNFERALKYDGDRVANLYFGGLGAYLGHDYQLATRHYQRGLDMAQKGRVDKRDAHLVVECEKGMTLAQQALIKQQQEQAAKAK